MWPLIQYLKWLFPHGVELWPRFCSLTRTIIEGDKEMSIQSSMNTKWSSFPAKNFNFNGHTWYWGEDKTYCKKSKIDQGHCYCIGQKKGKRVAFLLDMWDRGEKVSLIWNIQNIDLTGAATTYSVDSRAIYIQNKMTASAEGETQALQNGDVEGETKITIQVGSLSPLF